MSWNRQYRPRQIADLHLTSVREYFLSLLKTESFPQVFLFTGGKGTGKTSTARIIGALLNDPANASRVEQLFFKKKTDATKLVEPDPQSSIADRIFSGNSYIVQELDAASNRGIDDVRALRDRVSLPPQEGLMSVYILDEVHMLTTEAFNALLKLLEEPPQHVIFILATTELAKIPATIVSRCQVVQFHKASAEEIESALTNILKQEKRKADPKVLEIIAERADGSFRDAVKLLEMVAQVGEITPENAEPLLHMGLEDRIVALLDALLEKDPKQVVELFETLREHNADAKQVHTQLLSYLHKQLLAALKVIDQTAKLPQKTSTFLLKELADVSLSSATPIPLLLLELKFLELIERSQKKASPPESSSLPPSAKVIVKTSVASISESEPDVIKSAAALPSMATAETSTSTPTTTITAAPVRRTIQEESWDTSQLGDGQIVFEKWQELLLKAVEFNFGLATLLKAAKPISGETGKITISVFYKFHQEQLAQPKFVKLIDTLFSSVAGGHIKLECVLAQEPAHAELQDVSLPAENLAELAVSSLM